MIKYLLVAVLSIFVLSGCTNETSARKSLSSAGYTDISITGYDFFGCSKDDSFHTGFRAKGQDGRAVNGVVCGSLFFKGNTIRTF